MECSSSQSQFIFNDQYLEGKRVLFLGYECWDYRLHISEAIKRAGASLDYFPVMKYHMPWNYIYWLLCITSTRLFKEYNRAYARSILKWVNGRTYDYVFVIQGWQLPREFYEELRHLNPRARFLNYHWDSVRQTNHGNTLLDLIPLFDKVYSFDREDCVVHKGLNYLPLFYVDYYGQLRRESCGLVQDIDLLFIGSLCQYRRYRYIVDIEEICQRSGIKFTHYICVSKRFFVRNLLTGKILHNVHSRALSQDKIIDFYRRSKAILDLPQHIQTGLPMRIFEALGAGKKLVTSNKHIVKEPFYDPRNILIFDPDDPSIDMDFIRDRDFVWNDNLESYALPNWLKAIFTDKELPV